MTVCKYRDVSERDMDLLFMEAFVTDHEFPKLFLEKTEQAVVPAKGMYILHKTDRDAVDLTISGAASRMKDLLTVRHWLRDNVDRRIELEKTGKSASFRIRVPKIQMGVPFERWNMDELNSCFETIQELNDLAQLFKIIDEVVFNNN